MIAANFNDRMIRNHDENSLAKLVSDKTKGHFFLKPVKTKESPRLGNALYSNTWHYY